MFHTLIDLIKTLTFWGDKKKIKNNPMGMLKMEIQYLVRTNIYWMRIIAYYILKKKW